MYALMREIELNIGNSYSDNYDAGTFGSPKSSFPASLRHSWERLLKRSGVLPRRDLREFFSGLEPFIWFSGRFDKLYRDLADENSRQLLIKISAFRVLGHTKVRLPVNNEDYWRERMVLSGLAQQSNPITAGRFQLYRHDLSEIGFGISLYAPYLGPQNAFMRRQYEYRSPAIHIKADKGEQVIDGGACWGDTSLYFAHEVGVLGNVYAFEFIESNVAVLRKNLELNPSYATRVEVVPQPLWSMPGVTLFFKDRGPSSRGAAETGENANAYERHVSTTIDEFVRHRRLAKVDFIKMDVEGAELEALRGAEETIRSFQPKLAISVYHSISDFVDVFEFVSGLGLGYKFYLGHYSIHWHETVLFAVTAHHSFED